MAVKMGLRQTNNFQRICVSLPLYLFPCVCVCKIKQKQRTNYNVQGVKESWRD